MLQVCYKYAWLESGYRQLVNKLRKVRKHFGSKLGRGELVNYKRMVANKEKMVQIGYLFKLHLALGER